MFLFSCLVFVMVDLINWLQNQLNDIFCLHSIDQTLPTMKINLKIIENQAVSLLQSILHLNVYIHQVYIDHLWENVHLLQDTICLNKICKLIIFWKATARNVTHWYWWSCIKLIKFHLLLKVNISAKKGEGYGCCWIHRKHLAS